MLLNEMKRREFLGSAAALAAGGLAGCAANPVTGDTQLMLVSEEQEIQIDRQYAPHQFSTDYGPVQDANLNTYVETVGKNLAARSHRSRVPYSFRVVNANHINAYAFPGGSIACTRGILINLEDEAELAALLGHELGHVNARHTAERMSKGTLFSLLAVGVGVAVGAKSSELGGVAAALGMAGAGLLLASYSRDNERQADALGMEYAVKSGYHPHGAVDLLDVLRRTSKRQPGAIELMFATHPMSEERYQLLADLEKSKYAGDQKLPTHRERYLDQTASLRKIKGPIQKMQDAEKALGQKKYGEAETLLNEALKEAPNDYTGLVLLSKCLIVQDKYDQAQPYLNRAKQVYPGEAQARYLSGLNQAKRKDFGQAYEEFAAYERLLPGNPKTIFLKGYAKEGMKQNREAAQEYNRYLQQVSDGDEAKYAYRRLVEWGYIKPKK
ncbi:MAG: M48 family metalloprotease [Desulfobacterota bacterium]|jgi:predicted Zn-dependent protease|nr:M48 family metalloprotease [Thermodesulfobacteriota bacterium]